MMRNLETSEPQPTVQSAYDVIVIGGGPAGSTVGALVAENGYNVLVLERSTFPRFHVGESLIPETYWTFKRLGVLDQLRQSAFQKKYSVQFVNENGTESAPFYFDDYNPHECSQTWQVWRDDFDQMLLQNVAAKGAVVRTDAQVMDVMFDGDQATGVRVRFATDKDKNTRTINCQVVVDASGQSAFLASRLGLKITDPRLKKGSIWTYFRGAYRNSGRDEGATIILQTKGKKSWFWYIPLANDTVSVGVTGGMNYMLARGRGCAADIFNQELQRCPGMAQRLQNATRCKDFFTTKDFSYKAGKAAGPGWLLVGDAFGFIDPVYSTGVFLALKSGEFAADAILEAFARKDFSCEQLGCWQKQFIDGVELFRKLVYAFYTPGFSFGRFLREHPQYKTNLVDMLIGNIFKPGVGEMFDAMSKVLPPVDPTVSAASE